MPKRHWKSYELKKLGLHHKSIRAILRIQRKEIYYDRKQSLLKLQAANMLNNMDLSMVYNPYYYDETV